MKLTKEEVVAGMKALWDLRDRSYDDARNAMWKKGLFWTLDDVDWLGQSNMNLEEGFECGDIVTGATFVANALKSSLGYYFCREWMFDKPNVFCVGTWLRANGVALS